MIYRQVHTTRSTSCAITGLLAMDPWARLREDCEPLTHELDIQKRQRIRSHTTGQWVLVLLRSVKDGLCR